MILLTDVLCIWLLGDFAFLVPLTATLVPNTAHWITAHFASWWPEFVVGVTSDITRVHHFALHITFTRDLTISWGDWTITTSVENTFNLVLPVSVAIVTSRSGTD